MSLSVHVSVCVCVCVFLCLCVCVFVCSCMCVGTSVFPNASSSFSSECVSMHVCEDKALFAALRSRYVSIFS